MKIVLTPDWFLGKDVLIDSFSFIVLFLFFIFCWRYYKLNKKKNFLYLGSGFFLIAIAQLAVIFTKLILYYDTTFTQEIGQMVVTYNFVSSVDIFYYIGFFFHKLLTLIGFYVIYRLPIKKKSPGDFILALFFIIISVAFSVNVNFIFHVTVLVLLVMIINNYYQIYKKNKFVNTKILIAAFCILALAHILFTFSELNKIFGKPEGYYGNIFVIANFIELTSYIILLFLIIRIKYGTEKKKSYGYNMRYAGYDSRKRR